MRLSGLERLYARFHHSGDVRALARVFDRTAPELLRVATYLTGDANLAEDLVQSVFLVVIEADSFEEGRPLLPWMLGILARKAREQHRLSRRRIDAARLRTEQLHDPVADLCHSEFLQHLELAIEGLPNPYGQVLRLYLLHGLSSTEIGGVLDRPPGTVRTQLSRGMEMLRRGLPKDHAALGAFPLAPLSSLRGLRDKILHKATLTTRTSAGALGGLMGGVVLMKKIALWTSVAAVCVTLIGLTFWSGTVPRVPNGIETPPVEAPMTAALPRDAGSGRPENPVATRTARRELVEGTPLGALRLEVCFADDTPAPDVGVTLGQPGQDAPPIQGRTDPSGVLALEGLRPGEVRIGFDRNRKQFRASVHAGRETSTRIVLPDGLDLIGTVRDSGGRRVRGASVWVESNDLAGMPVLLARCDGEGRFAVRGAASALRIWARAAGFTPSEPRMHYGTPGALIGVELVLGRKAGAVQGQVVDDQGSPVEGAQLGLALDVGVDQGGRRVLHLTTGPHGRFGSDEVPHGSHAIIARHGEAVAWTAFDSDADPATPLLLRLQSGARVYGHVLDGTRTPVAGTSIAARARIPGLPLSLFELTDTVCSSGPDGSYSLEGLLVGTYLLTAEHGGQRAELTAELRGADFLWDPVFPGRGELHIQLVDADGHPLPGWKVAVETEERGQVHSGVTDAEGRHRVDQLEPREYVLAVHAPLTGTTDWVTFPALVRGGVSTSEREIRLQLFEDARPSIFLTGRAIDTRGEPLGNAWVQLAQEGWNIQQNHYTQLDTGRFRIGPLSPGVYSLAVIPDGYPPRFLEGRRLYAGEEWDLGDLRFDQPAILLLRVRGASSDGLRAWLQGNDRRVSSSVEGAQLTLAPCPPGSYRLHVVGTDTAPLTRDVELDSGVNTLELEVDSAVPVTLELVHPDHLQRRVAANVALEVFDRSGALVFSEFFRAGMTDRQERILRLRRGLLPGSYRVVATDRDFSWRAEAGLRVSADTTLRLELR